MFAEEDLPPLPPPHPVAAWFNDEELMRIFRLIIAKEQPNEARKVNDVHVEELPTDELIASSGDHFLLRLTGSKKNWPYIEVRYAFIKVVRGPVADTFLHADDVDMVVSKERLIMLQLLPNYLHGYIGERWCPTMYSIKRPYLVFEHLAPDQWEMKLDIEDNRPVLETVMATLARFHCFTMITEDRMTAARRKQVPLAPRCSLAEEFSDMLEEPRFLLRPDAKWYPYLIGLTKSLAKLFKFNEISVEARFRRACTSVRASKIHKNVICHGEVISRNLMFDKTLPKPEKCYLVDFQSYRYSPLVTDILQFLHIHTTKKFRQENEQGLLEIYHKVMKETIQKNNPRFTIRIPTLDEIKKGMKDLRVFGLVNACIYHPLLCLDVEVMRAIRNQNGNIYQNLMVVERTELVFSHMRNNEAYRNKIRQSLIELIEHVET